MAAMWESRVYGVSLLCLSRRLFVTVVCGGLAIACTVALILWALEEGAIDLLVGDADGAQRVHAKDCTGLSCYEVLSCAGMRETTQHVREPWASLSGEIWFSLGFYGAMYGCKWPLRWAWQYMVVIVLAFLILATADAAYIVSCDELPTSVVRQCLLWGPISPLSLRIQKDIRHMDSFSMDAIYKVTGGFNVLRWFAGVALAQVLFLAYLAQQTRFLSWVIEKGALGIGLNFGVDRWDESISLEATKWRLACDHQKRLDRQKDIQAAKEQVFAETHGYPMAMPKHYGATLESGLEDLGEEYAHAAASVKEYIHDVVPDMHVDPDWFLGYPVKLEDVHRSAQLDFEAAAHQDLEEAEGKRIEL